MRNSSMGPSIYPMTYRTMRGRSTMEQRANVYFKKNIIVHLINIYRLVT